MAESLARASSDYTASVSSPFVVSSYFHMHILVMASKRIVVKLNGCKWTLNFYHKFGVKDLGRAQLDSFSLAHMALSGELSLEASFQHGFFLVTVCLGHGVPWSRCALHVSVLWLLSHPQRLTLQGPNMCYSQGNHTAWLPRGKKHNDSLSSPPYLIGQIKHRVTYSPGGNEHHIIERGSGVSIS